MQTRLQLDDIDPGLDKYLVNQANMLDDNLMVTLLIPIGLLAST